MFSSSSIYFKASSSRCSRPLFDCLISIRVGRSFFIPNTAAHWVYCIISTLASFYMNRLVFPWPGFEPITALVVPRDWTLNSHRITLLVWYVWLCNMPIFSETGHSFVANFFQRNRCGTIKSFLGTTGIISTFAWCWCLIVLS